MNTLSSYSPLQQLTLTRLGRLKMLQRDVLPQLDATDYRVKLTLKALYSTYQDLQELGLEDVARLLLEQPRKASSINQAAKPTGQLEQTDLSTELEKPGDPSLS